MPSKKNFILVLKKFLSDCNLEPLKFVIFVLETHRVFSLVGFVFQVPVGVPFPPWAFEACRQAVPAHLRRDVLLLGKRYNVQEAHESGIIGKVVDNDSTDALLDTGKRFFFSSIFLY